MSDYVPVNWVDGSTPVNAANLKHMDDAIDQAYTTLNAKVDVPSGGLSPGQGVLWDGTKWIAVTPELVANKGQANGYAPLGSDSKIPAIYLPAGGGGGGGLDWEGAYAPATAYVKGDVVTYNGVVYGAVNDSTGQTPPAASGIPTSFLPTPLVTALPTSGLFDGMQVDLTDSLTAPTYTWRMRYVAAKATNKWVLVGGGGYIKAEENTTEPTYSAFAWVDLGPPNVSVTVPVTGLWAVEFHANLTAASASTRYIAVKLGAAATQAADGITTTTSPHGNTRYMERQLSAGDVLKFQVQTSASTITVRIPFWLRIRPVAVGG